MIDVILHTLGKTPDGKTVYIDDDNRMYVIYGDYAVMYNGEVKIPINNKDWKGIIGNCKSERK